MDGRVSTPGRFESCNWRRSETDQGLKVVEPGPMANLCRRTFEQNPDRQLEGVNVDRTFTDKASGKDAKRPQSEALMRFARTGDTVIVYSMDRLAQSRRFAPHRANTDAARRAY